MGKKDTKPKTKKINTNKLTRLLMKALSFVILFGFAGYGLLMAMSTLQEQVAIVLVAVVIVFTADNVFRS